VTLDSFIETYYYLSHRPDLAMVMQSYCATSSLDAPLRLTASQLRNFLVFDQKEDHTQVWTVAWCMMGCEW
jgi:hypothetical protein